MSQKLKLKPTLQAKFKSNATAWKFFRAQPTAYQRTATWWVMTARREETQMRRLTLLIQDSGKKLRVKLMTAAGGKRRPRSH